MGVGEFSMVIIIVLVLLGIFILAREFWCWYWKINERRDILKNIEKLLTEQNTSNTNLDTDLKPCPNCKKSIQPAARVCPFCNYAHPFVEERTREQVIMIDELVKNGLKDGEIAEKFNSDKIECLTNGGVWDGELIGKIRKNFDEY